jgi:hypothetical protein
MISWQDVLIRDMACKYHMTERTMKEIVYSPIYFAKRVVKDNNDIRPVRIPFLGLFAQKESFNKSRRLSSVYERSKAFIVKGDIANKDKALNKIEEYYTNGLFDELVDYMKSIGMKVKYRRA